MQGLLSFAGFSALLRVVYAQDCSETFTPITAEDFVTSLHPGWNLGNTLDAIPDEGSWNNAPVEAETFDTIKDSGFTSVRLPGNAILHLRCRLLIWRSYLDAPFHRRVS